MPFVETVNQQDILKFNYWKKHSNIRSKSSQHTGISLKNPKKIAAGIPAILSALKFVKTEVGISNESNYLIHQSKRWI